MEMIFKLLVLIGAINILIATGTSDMSTIITGGLIGLLMLVVGLKGLNVMQ